MLLALPVAAGEVPQPLPVFAQWREQRQNRLAGALRRNPAPRKVPASLQVQQPAGWRPWVVVKAQEPQNYPPCDLLWSTRMERAA